MNHHMRSYVPHYFSIEDILATNERLPCKFAVPVLRLGFLDQASDSEDIAAGTKLELPYWLAQPLNVQRRAVVSVDIPKIYKETYREILKADATVVDLHKLNIFFYEFGSYICGLNHTETAAIADILAQVFKERFRLVMDWALNAGMDPTVVQRLDYLEIMLFKEGHQAQKQLHEWLTKGAGLIRAADLVISHKKRKHTALDGF